MLDLMYHRCCFCRGDYKPHRALNKHMFRFSGSPGTDEHGGTIRLRQKKLCSSTGAIEVLLFLSGDRVIFCPPCAADHTWPVSSVSMLVACCRWWSLVARSKKKETPVYCSGFLYPGSGGTTVRIVARAVRTAKQN